MTIEQRLDRIETLLRGNITEVMNVKEVAAFLKLSESRIRHMVAGKEIPHYRNSKGQVSFKKSEIEAWRLGERVKTNEELEIQAATYMALKRI